MIHGKVLRPILNDDHLIVTLKIDVDYKKVDVERRVKFIERMECVLEQEWRFLKGMEDL